MSWDNCEIEAEWVTPNTFDCDDVGTHDYDLTVLDIWGNQTTCSKTVTVVDDMPPVAMCQNITVQLDANGMATITATQIDNGSYDNCDIVSWVLDDYYFDCGDIGGNTVYLTVTDEHGLSSSCSATVTVEDNVPPVVAIDELEVVLHENGEYVLTEDDLDLVRASVSDNCSSWDYLMGTIEFDYESYECVSVYQDQILTVTVTDEYDNTTIKEVIVKVLDETDPVAMCVGPMELMLDASGNASLLPGDINDAADRESVPVWARNYNDLEGGSYDACGIVFMELDKYFFDCDDLGENIVTLTVVDPSGNDATCTTTVTVVDNTVPSVTCKDAELALGADGTATLTEDMVVEGVADVCNGSTTVVLSQTAFDCTMVGENEVTVTVTDGSGNVTECTATVTVTDAEAPVVDAIDDVAVTLEPGTCVAVITAQYPTPVVTDICDVEAVLVNGLGPNGIFPLGTTTETWRFTDSAGNETMVSFDVVVSTYNGAPTVDAVADMVAELGDPAVAVTLSGISYGVDCEAQEVTGVYASSSDKDIATVDVAYTMGDATATLTVTPVAVGEVTVTVLVTDNGGTANGGMDETTITFKVSVVDEKTVTSAWDIEGGLEVNMYPNPTRDMVHFDISNTETSDVDVALYAITGEQIMRKMFSVGENVSLDVTQQVSGVYFVKLDINGTQIVKKLVIDKK